MDQTNKNDRRQTMEEARNTLLKRIEDAEQRLDDLMGDEPDDDGGARYERWEEKVSELEDLIDRCRESWEKLHSIAEQYNLGYEESDWIV